MKRLNFILTLLLSATITSCSNSTTPKIDTDPSEKSRNKVSQPISKESDSFEPEPSKTREFVKLSEDNSPENYDGTYFYTEENFETQIRVNGNGWSGRTSLYGETEYDFGIVNGDKIYDESGMVEIGYIDGKSLITSLGGHRVTLMKR